MAKPNELARREKMESGFEKFRNKKPKNEGGQRWDKRKKTRGKRLSGRV